MAQNVLRVMKQGFVPLITIALHPAGVNAQTAGMAPPPLAAVDAPATQPVNGYAAQLKRKPGMSPAVYNHQPYTPVKKPSDDGQLPEIDMFVGESRVFPAPGVGRIAVGNGTILTAAALDGKEVILFANAVGTSSLFIWNEDGRYQRVKINIVPGDTSRYAREIAAFLSGMPKAKASIIGDKVIVEGDDLADADIARIELLAARYPQIVNFTNRMGFEKMVMLDVKVVEFPLNELKQLGLRWGTTGGVAIGGIWSPLRRGNHDAYEIAIRSGQANAVPIAGALGAPTVVPSSLTILNAINLGLNATLDLLAQQGRTTILAEPQLSARNGARASFLAGGEFPYVVSTINGPTVQYKSYGVKLDIQPRVDKSGNIRATVDTEVSNIDGSISTSVGPALLTRRTNTEFNVRAGETIVLSGLVQRENATSVEKLPGLGDLPVLGALFRSHRYQNKETELVVFVTPTVVDARSPDMVDRVQKTNDRLGQRLGMLSGLSEPLQPASQFEVQREPGTEPRTQAAPEIAAGVAGKTVAPGTIEKLTLTGLPLRGQYSVSRDRVALHATPDVNAPVVATLTQGEMVHGLDQADRGSWSAVHAQGRRGWVAAQSLQPVAPTP